MQKFEKKHYDIDTEIVIIKTTLERILGHHQEFKENLESFDNKFEKIIEIANREKIERMDSINSIAKELHGRINAILFSILAGAGLFIAGIITWLVQKSSA